MLLLLLAAAALPLQAAAQLYIPTDLGCDAEDELLGNLRWLRSVCAEVGAAFADDATPVPTTIADLGCARAARRVATSCGGLLSSSPWFASRRAALDAAVASAANLPDDSASTYHIADPSLSAVHSCGATLDDGFAQFPTARNGQSYVTIDVGPSHGNLRLDVDHLSLDAKNNDNFRLYSDSDLNDELLLVLSGDLPLDGPIELWESKVTLLLVSDGAGSRTSLGLTVSCVCEDSATFVDGDGDGCAAYRDGEKHARCASLLPPADEHARFMCPVACGACEPDPCPPDDASPCTHGGTCTRVDGSTCTASDLAARSAAVTAECCDEPTEDCSSGQPATCNLGCAAVLVPYYQDCQGALQGDAEILAAVQSAVQQCASTPRYQCDCAKGWRGDQCEVRPRTVLCITSGVHLSRGLVARTHIRV